MERTPIAMVTSWFFGIGVKTSEGSPLPLQFFATLIDIILALEIGGSENNLGEKRLCLLCINPKTQLYNSFSLFYSCFCFVMFYWFIFIFESRGVYAEEKSRLKHGFFLNVIFKKYTFDTFIIKICFERILFTILFIKLHMHVL